MTCQIGSYELNRPIVVTADFNGVDPVPVVLRLKNPLGAIAVYTYGVDGALIRTNAGFYELEFIGSIPQFWQYRWEGTVGGRLVANQSSLWVAPVGSDGFAPAQQDGGGGGSCGSPIVITDPTPEIKINIPQITVHVGDTCPDQQQERQLPRAIADFTASAGVPVYLKADGHLGLAIATSDLTATVAGFTVGAATPGAFVDYDPDGSIELQDWTAIAGTALLTTGATYFLSPSVAGRITATPPPTNVWNAIVGQALSLVELSIEIQGAIAP